MGNNDTHQRLPQAANSAEKEIRSRMAEASAVIGGVLSSIQTIAGTTSCKGVQIHALYKYAIEHECWFDSIGELGVFSDRGSENEVYISHDRRTVYKLNDFRYSDDNLQPFFERINAHNLYFPECAYDLIGFAHNQKGDVCALLTQPFIIAKREATEEEIMNAMLYMGFTPCLNGEYFTNGEYDIFDALPNNVLVGIDDNLYFIDTIIYRSEKDNFETYQSLSPRYNR